MLDDAMKERFANADGNIAAYQSGQTFEHDRASPARWPTAID
jgi:hypothetical protein